MRLNYHLILFSLVLLIFVLPGCQKGIPDIDFSNNTGTTKIDTTTNTDTTNIPDTSLYHISGTGAQDTGETLLAFNTATSGILEILDANGNVVKQKITTLRIEDFQKWNINGKIRYTYFQTDGAYSLANLQGTEEGYQIICDTNLNEIKKVSLISHANVDATTSDKTDSHEFIYLDDDHYITLTYQVASPANIPDSLHPASDARVINCIIQEINKGQVVFQWQSIDYPEFYGASVENNNFSDSVTTMDYMHMNSVCIDPKDNNLICSMRNLDQIIKINRTTGAIMWRLGGKTSDFALTEEQNFLRQHFARLTDNNQTLIFVDNGEKLLRPYSRILEFQLDENNKSINSFKAYTIPDRFIQFAGSVEKTGDIYFIGGGLSNYTLEINYVTNDVLFRLNQNYPSYRSLNY